MKTKSNLYLSRKYCECDDPQPVILSPVDTVYTCKSCGRIIENKSGINTCDAEFY